MQKPVLVIKLGSAVITADDGSINRQLIEKLPIEIAGLLNSYRVVLVSSGAVSSGKALLKHYRGTLVERKAAAAIGNPLLIQLYHQYFSKHDIHVAQALCERHHFSNRQQFLQLKETFVELWENNIVPVVNENDIVSNIELKFSDNDELATLIAIGFDAETLIICTSVGGFWNRNKEIIPVIENIDSDILGCVSNETSGVGLGGMLSKLTFTKLATSLGIRVIMCGIGGDKPFTDALQGKNGSVFRARQANLKARQKWLASGSITLGCVEVDKGAEKALASRKSLLTVGIKKVQGRFSEGEVVQLINEEGTILGVAKMRLGASDITKNLSTRNVLAAHADDIVLL